MESARKHQRRRGLVTLLDRRSIIAAALIAGLAALAVTAVVSLRNVQTARSDFIADYVSAKEFSSGGDVYAPMRELVHKHVGEATATFEVDANPHPPAAILVFVPLAALPYTTARVAWFAISALLIGLSCAAVTKKLFGDRLFAVAVGMACFALPMTYLELKLGHYQAVILALLVAAWLQLQKGRETSAGVLIGAAAALKLFPVFLIIPLLRRRRFRAATALVVGAFVITAATSVAIGVRATTDFVTEASPDNFRTFRATPHNISLTAEPFRWLTVSESRPGAADRPALASILAAGIVIALVFAAAATPANTTGDPYWAAVPLMLLASPISWQNYGVLLLPLLVVAYAQRSTLSPLQAAALVGGAALVAFGGPPWLRTGESDLKQVFGYGVPTYGLILLAVADWLPSRAPAVAAAATQPAGVR